MDLELDEEQLELADHARKVLEDTCPPSLVRAVFEGHGSGDELWATLVELGWPAVAAPERAGGLGLGVVAEAVLAAGLGRAVAPVPYLSTVTQFAALLAEAGESAEALWTQVNEGRLTGALALGEEGGYRTADIEAVATPDGGAWRISGTKIAVPGAAAAAAIAVVARAAGTTGGEGLGTFLVDGSMHGCRVDPITTLDPTTPLANVHLDEVEVEEHQVLLDPRDPQSGSAVERVRRHATVMLAMSCVATCRAIFERTLAYTKTRHQFGRPIGQFQALKHRLADAYLAVERAEALCWYAVLCVSEQDAEAAVAVAMAKAAAGECRRLVTRDGLQLHGAVGFTWEQDLHFWIKRATVTALLYGDVETQRAALAPLLGLAASPAPREAAP